MTSLSLGTLFITFLNKYLEEKQTSTSYDYDSKAHLFYLNLF